MTCVDNEFPWPIGVMSFQRPALLRQVLQSLKQQNLAFDEGELYLFQDGFIDGFDNAPLAQEKNYDACIDVFLEIFPNGKVLKSKTNLGVALNFDRAERMFFADRKFDAALFLEDDLVLSPHYLKIIRTLLDYALVTPLVAHVAAYGDHRASLEAQTQNKRKIIAMKHKWGFGLTRRQWERQEALVEGYLEIVRQRPYMKRDHAAIRAYYDKLGYHSPGTSQDAMKDVASAVLGATKIMSFACFGKYIGRVGVHQREEDYVKEGYDATALFPEDIDDFEFPGEIELQRMVAVHRAGHARPPAGEAAAKPSPPRAPVAVTASSSDLIAAAYRALLNREPDLPGLTSYERLFASHPPADAVHRMIRSMLASGEFARKWKPPGGPAAS